MDTIVLESGNDWRVETFVLILSRPEDVSVKAAGALIECVIFIFRLPQLSPPVRSSSRNSQNCFVLCVFSALTHKTGSRLSWVR